MVDDFPEGFETGSDIDPVLLLAAVGEALTAWEVMELQLAHLYTIFIGSPGSISAMQDYGVKYGIFVRRTQAILCAADQYFIRKPDQEIEGAIDGFVQRAINLSIERHRIAHGMLKAVAVPSPSGMVSMAYVTYLIGPPWYSQKSLRVENFGMDLDEIKSFTQQFQVLGQELFEFLPKLSP